MAKILLVEDDKALREIYGVRLLAEGYDIVSAGDGEEALAVAIREKPDLIISDIMMPKISGFEMLDLLRSNDATKNIKVIMMTALSGEQHRERGERLGADRYLVKSQVGIEDVVNTVHEILGDRAGAALPPAMPAPNQSPVNPPAATMPSTTAGVPAPVLPATPPSVPVVTAPNLPPPVASTPEITPIVDTPTAPEMPAAAPVLPPVAPPASVAPEPAPPPIDNTPTLQPANPPAVDLAQSGSHVGNRVVQPTGESLSPQVDMTSLIANEEAKDTPVPYPVATNTAAPTPSSPEIQVSPTGTVNADDLPAVPLGPSPTFPNQL